MAANAVDYVRTFNRFELKYLLEVDRARRFLADLGGYCRMDPHSDPERGYSVYSLYWDTPDLECFWEKVDGQKYRRKLRLRRYGDGASVFVEIKQRIDRTVQKRRARMDSEAAAEMFSAAGVGPDAGHGELDPVLQEALYLAHRRRLEPKLAVLYRRLAYFGNYDSELRITLDTRVQYDAHALDIRKPFETGKYALEPKLGVLEIKFNERVPIWLTKLTAHHDLQIVRFSKYCAAASAEFFDGAHT